MALEEEMLRDRPTVARGEAKPPSPFDRIARALATLVLLAAFTFVYWVPFQLLGPTAAALVVAALTLLGIGTASRLRRLRLRVDELEARLEPPPAQK